MKISAEDFIRAWQGAATVKEVAEKTGLTEFRAIHKASYFRGKGIPLKYFKDKDWTALAKLAESLNPDATDAD